jgi:transcriptional regulator with XRE-family HTH domain
MKEIGKPNRRIINIEESIADMPKEQAEYVDKSMALARYISDFSKSPEFNQTEVASKLGKHISEISKWVSGFHNLTISSILKLESASSIKILNPEIFQQPVYAKVIVVWKNEETSHKPYLREDFQTFHSNPFASMSKFNPLKQTPIEQMNVKLG